MPLINVLPLRDKINCHTRPDARDVRMRKMARVRIGGKWSLAFRGGEIDSAVTGPTVPTEIVGKQLLWSVANLGKFGRWGRGESHIRQAVGRVWRWAQLSPLDREVEDPQINADRSQLSSPAFAGSDLLAFPESDGLACSLPSLMSSLHLCKVTVYFWVTAPLKKSGWFPFCRHPERGHFMGLLRAMHPILLCRSIPIWKVNVCLWHNF